MKYTTQLLFCCSIMVFGCKKNAAIPPEVINTNSIEAQVNITGRAPRTHSVKGETAVFSSYVDENQNRIISIWGYDGIFSLKLDFTNIDTGTYSFMETYNSGKTGGGLTYIEGTFFSSLLYFTTFETDTLGNNISRSTGSFTINKLNDTEIEGTMNAVLINGDGIECHISNAVFKGGIVKQY